jgi:hypothetical protein
MVILFSRNQSLNQEEMKGTLEVIILALTGMNLICPLLSQWIHLSVQRKLHLSLRYILHLTLQRKLNRLTQA